MNDIEKVLKNLKDYENDKFRVTNLAYFSEILRKKLSESPYQDLNMRIALCNHLLKKSNVKDRKHVQELIQKLSEYGFHLINKGSPITYFSQSSDAEYLILSSKLSAYSWEKQVYQRLSPTRYNDKDVLNILWVIGDWRTVAIIDSELWNQIRSMEDRFLFYDKNGKPKGFDIKFYFSPPRLQIRSPKGNHKNIPGQEVLNRWDKLENNLLKNFCPINYKQAKEILETAETLMGLIRKNVVIKRSKIADTKRINYVSQAEFRNNFPKNSGSFQLEYNMLDSSEYTRADSVLYRNKIDERFRKKDKLKKSSLAKKVPSNDKYSDYFDFLEWYEIMHFAKVAKNLNILDEWGRNFLFNIGNILKWKAFGYDSEVTKKQKEYFSIVFNKFISLVPSDYRCVDYPCNKCEKLLELVKFKQKHREQTISENDFKNAQKGVSSIIKSQIEQKRNWKLNLKLYDWQSRCCNKWLENNKKGIVKVVTGAGKTVLALKIISLITRGGNNNNIRIFIIVPKIALLYQWVDELTEKLNVSLEDIGLFYGDEWGDFRENRIQIYVINSARDLLASYNDKLKMKGFKTLLIADECHRYGSKENSKIFNTSYTYTLGLSATPEREGDFNFDKKLVPNLGNIIFEYNYVDALNDEIIPPFSLINCTISLTENELFEYNKQSEGIKVIRKKLIKKYPILDGTPDYIKILNYISDKADSKEDRDLASMLKTLYSSRKMVIHDAENRYQAVFEILNRVFEEIKHPRILIFHEKIDFVERIHKLLIDEGIRSEVYHSQLSRIERNRALKRYKNGESNILVTCKALDEGLDVPNTNVGIIAASTQSIRQRIQRIGRVLRKAAGKQHSYIYTVFVPKYEDGIFKKEEIKELYGVANVEFWNLSSTEFEAKDIINNSKKSIDLKFCPNCKSDSIIDGFCIMCGHKLSPIVL